MSETKRIGNFLPENPFFLAPMAGFTDTTYRTLCGEKGAALTYTEMVSAKGLYYGDRKSPKLLEIGESEKPVGFQIFGSDPDIMAWAVEHLEKEKNVLIDVNMGCPVPKVVKNGEGSALLRKPELIYEIIKKMSNATDKPVTVKMRIGIDGMSENGFIEAIQAVESGGAAAVAIHGRTREQYYSGKASLEAIKAGVESVSIPVIGNGDILSYEDARNMMEATGCDFVMIGRGALGDPWIFQRLIGAHKGSAASDAIGRPSVEEVIDMIIRHYDGLEKDKGEYIAVREMRKYVGKYLRGIPGSAAVRGEVNCAKSGRELQDIVVGIKENC